MSDVQDPERSQVEVLAGKMGWNPDYEGEGAKSAEQFILDSREIMDGMTKRMRNQGKQLEEMNLAVSELKNHNETVYQLEVAKLKREIKTLKANRKEAIENGDTERVAEIDEQIEDLNNVPAPKKATPATPQEFSDWHEKNEWYESDNELTEFANRLSAGFKEDAVFQALPLTKRLKKIEKLVKAEFPEKFEATQKPTPPAGGVEGGGKKVNSKKVYALKDLPEDMQVSAKRFEKLGIMSVKDYIADQVKAGVLS
jgi:hypothetical protein